MKIPQKQADNQTTAGPAVKSGWAAGPTAGDTLSGTVCPLGEQVAKQRLVWVRLGRGGGASWRSCHSLLHHRISQLLPPLSF